MLQKNRDSLIVRIGLLGAVLVVLSTLLTGGSILWIFSHSIERMLDSHLMAYSDSVISQIEIRDDRVLLRNNGEYLLNLPRYWQVSRDGKALYKSSNLASWIPPRTEKTLDLQRFEWIEDGKRIAAVQATYLFPNNQKITLISGLDAAIAEAYVKQEQEGLAAPLYKILGFSSFLLVALCFALTYYATRPLKALRDALQSVRLGKADRIEGSYPREIAILTDEINRMLAYIAGVIARHRAFSGNLAHTLKTPLTVIANETDLAVVKEKLNELMGIIDRNLARVSMAGGSDILCAATPLLPVLRDIADGFGKVYRKRVDVDCSETVCFRGDKADLFEVLGNIIENACKYSRSCVSVSFRDGDIIIEDDGSGIAEASRDEVLKRGVRLDQRQKGSGLGLAVASDIVALYQGVILLGTSALGGLKVVITLPVRS